jgi:hypothetical protein
MAGNLLEPGSLLRAAKRRGVALSEPTAVQICALLKVSRGITLVGPLVRAGQLARAVLDSAIEVGAAHGSFEIRVATDLTDVMNAAARQDWLLLEEISGEELERVLRSLASEGSGRVVLVHEPTPGQMLPPIPHDLRRHFPLVETASGD